MSRAEIETKFHAIVGEIADDQRRVALAEAAAEISDAPSVDRVAALLAERPQTSVKSDQA
jgi:hypothetical protein